MLWNGGASTGAGSILLSESHLKYVVSGNLALITQYSPVKTFVDSDFKTK